MYVTDLLYGQFRVGGLAEKIIQMDFFSRLKDIGQLGALSVWKPCANYSRWEHCIGTWYLSQYTLRALQAKYPDLLLTGRTIELVGLSALLHDVGHGPFSHLFDKWTEKQCPDHPLAHHEDRSIWIVKKIAPEIGITAEEEEMICQLIRPQSQSENEILKRHPWLLHLINKGNVLPLDLDNVDYINRDALHLQGIPILSWEQVRNLLSGMRIVNNRLCFESDSLRDLESLLGCRLRFHQMFYHHPKTLASESRILYPFAECFSSVLDDSWWSYTDKDLKVTKTKARVKFHHPPISYLPEGVTGVWLHHLGNAFFQILDGKRHLVIID